MAKLITNIHCDSCENGILQLIVSKTKRGIITASAKDCNVCGRPGGLTTFSRLKQVVNPDYIKPLEECDRERDQEEKDSLG